MREAVQTTKRHCLGFGSSALVLLALLTFEGVFGARTAQSQVIFLDTNGDSLPGTGDALEVVGQTTANVWLWTNALSSGAPVICPTEEDLSITSYEFSLRAPGAQVSWGTYVNALPEFTPAGGPIQSADEFSVSYLAGQAMPAGRHLLGTLTLTVESGSPTLEFAPALSTNPNVGTSFGSQCPGVDMDNTLKLGRDWWESHGLIASDSLLTVVVPTSAQAPVGGEVVVTAIATTEDPSEPISIVVSGAPAGLQLYVDEQDGACRQGRVQGLATEEMIGVHNLQWVCTAGGDSDTASTALEVVLHNFPPEIWVNPSVSVNEGTILDLQVYADDPDGDAIDTFNASLVNLPPDHTATWSTSIGMTEGHLIWQPAFHHSGSYGVTFTAANFLSASAAVTITVANVPYAGPYLKVRAPLRSQKIKATYFNGVSGLPVGETVYNTNPDGEAAVPLGTCDTNGLNCTWWYKVRIDFPFQTTIGYWDEDDNGADPMVSNLELFPALEPGDRLTEYTVVGDPWKVRNLAGLTNVHEFFAQEYGYTVPSDIRMYTLAQYAFTMSLGMSVPPDSSGETRIADVIIAHEYGHAVQDHLAEQRTPCCAGECVHYGCGQVPPCDWRPFVEGMAEGMSEYFARKRFNVAYNDFRFHCGPGPLQEENVTYFVYLMSTRDPRGFLNTFALTRGLHTDAELQGYHLPLTMMEYWNAWNGAEDPSTFDVVQFHPGDWNASAFYALAIDRVTTGVEGRGADEGVAELVVTVGGEVDAGKRHLTVRTSVARGIQIGVFDVRGRLIGLGRVRSPGTGSVAYNLDLGERPGGVYFVRVSTEGGFPEAIVTKKIVHLP